MKWTKFEKTAGFTLVELIVVIAIMGILAGIGTAGYGGYVKYANKGADMQLVGNVIRAVETGNNSGAFVSNEITQASKDGAQLPLGIVTLYNDASVNVGQIQQTETECLHTETVQIFSGQPITMYEGRIGYLYEENGTGRTAVPVYSGVESVTYCVEHSSTEAKNKLAASSMEEQRVRGTYVYGGYTKQMKTAYVDSDGSIMAGLVTGHTVGGKAVGSAMATGSAVEGDVLDSCLKAAFGTDYSGDLVLKYDGWTDQTMSISYNAAQTMLSDSKTLSNILALASGEGNSFGISKEYTNGAHVVADFAGHVATHSDTFIADWQKIDNGEIAYDQAFGGFARAAVPGETAREVYSAARMAYNSSLAEYVKENHGDDNGANHARHISIYYTDSANVPLVGELGLPGVVCESAFAADVDTKLHSDVKNCTKCKDLYSTYVSSGASLEAAKGMVEMMTTVKELETTEEGTPRYTNANDFYSYYASYLNQFNSMFNSVKNNVKGKSAIVLTFYAKDGLVDVEVSPLSADPRNEE